MPGLAELICVVGSRKGRCHRGFPGFRWGVMTANESERAAKPSIPSTIAGCVRFLTLIQCFDRPPRYGPVAMLADQTLEARATCSAESGVISSPDLRPFFLTMLLYSLLLIAQI
jgi:hypothetical protein